MNKEYVFNYGNCLGCGGPLLYVPEENSCRCDPCGGFLYLEEIYVYHARIRKEKKAWSAAYFRNLIRKRKKEIKGWSNPFED